MNEKHVTLWTLANKFSSREMKIQAEQAGGKSGHKEKITLNITEVSATQSWSCQKMWLTFQHHYVYCSLQSPVIFKFHWARVASSVSYCCLWFGQRQISGFNVIYRRQSFDVVLNLLPGKFFQIEGEEVLWIVRKGAWGEFRSKVPLNFLNPLFFHLFPGNTRN